MEPYINFKNSQPDGNYANQNSNYPLVRQSSVFSLTFDEFQNTLGGGLSNDLGSINMEELLKSIWSAEEGTQAVVSSICGGEGSAGNGSLQRRGSLVLPRTISQKTVDEVWREVHKETKDGIANEVSNLGQREPSLAEMTLEEFFFRAGVVKEDIKPYTGSQSTNGNKFGLNIGFQNPTQNLGVFGNQFQPIYPKQTAVSLSTPLCGNNTAQLSSPRARTPLVGVMNDLNNDVVQIKEGLHNAIVKSSTETPSPLPPPCNFGAGGRGRRSNGSLEKVVERRHKRMIKNRESAARSRARKQAYELELEAEVAKLKEINQELRTKQEEYLKTQKNQMSETINSPWVGKRRCLRRTLTGHL